MPVGLQMLVHLQKHPELVRTLKLKIPTLLNGIYLLGLNRSSENLVAHQDNPSRCFCLSQSRYFSAFSISKHLL